MKTYSIIGTLVLSTLIGSNAVYADETTPVSEQLVNTLTQLAGGPHKGYRANHAKGIMIEGQFTPSPEAKTLSIADHLQGANTTVLARYSDATGVPTIPDANGNSFPKGLAIRFQFANGQYTDLVTISVPTFPVSTPEDFLAMLNAVAASSSSQSKPSPIETFLANHPTALTWVNMAKPAPVSLANLPFFGINAFKFTNATGETHYGRYEIKPVKGERYLIDSERGKAANDYLMDGIQTELLQHPVEYDITVQIAEAGDTTTDPTVRWPDNRKRVKLGRLTFHRTIENSLLTEKKIMFNPLTLPNGIEASDDPILKIRPSAYAVSYGRRLAE